MTRNPDKTTLRPSPSALLLLSLFVLVGAPATARAKSHGKGRSSSKAAASSKSTSPTELESIPPPPAAATPEVTPAPTKIEAPGPSSSSASSMSPLVAGDSGGLAPAAATTAPATTGPSATPEPATTVTPATEAESPSDAAAPAEPASFVEHLGAEAYPGQKRGLYGGSLWLEPSFHGLQWPYMPHTGVGISGSAWIDNGYETISRGLINSADTKQYVQQGRAVLRATPTYAKGTFFVQGQMEVVGNKDQVRSQSNANSGIVDIDDLWLRVGQWNAWDVKVGRFEGWEVYHTGMGLDINTIERRGAIQGSFGGTAERPDYYGLTYLHDRPSDQGTGDIALHVFPARFLRLELLGQIGANVVAADFGNNSLGGRGVAILDLGFLKVKFGGEWVKSTPDYTMTVPLLDGTNQPILGPDGNPIQIKQVSKQSSTQHGLGWAVQLILDPTVELGANFGVGLGDQTDDKGNPIDKAATTTYSVGGFANFSVGSFLPPPMRDLLVGAGVNWTTQKDLHRDPSDGKVDYTANLQTFGAVQYIVARQLFIKAVFAYARSDFDLSFGGGQWSNYMYSGRIRLMYLF